MNSLPELGLNEDESHVQRVLAALIGNFWSSQGAESVFLGVLPPGEEGTWIALQMDEELTTVMVSQLVGEDALAPAEIEILAAAGFEIDEDPHGQASFEIRNDAGVGESIDVAAGLAAVAVLRVFRPYFAPFDVRGDWDLQHLG